MQKTTCAADCVEDLRLPRQHDRKDGFCREKKNLTAVTKQIIPYFVPGNRSNMTERQNEADENSSD